MVLLSYPIHARALLHVMMDIQEKAKEVIIIAFIFGDFMVEIFLGMGLLTNTAKISAAHY